ncbi:MAG: hypothetical protein R2880_08125 [Deinococcales bacterium]
MAKILVEIQCSGCGRVQRLSKNKVEKCDYYICGFRDCKVNPDWEPEKPLNVIKVIIPNAAGGFSGIRFELPTKEDLEAIDRAIAIRDAGLEQLKKKGPTS